MTTVIKIGGSVLEPEPDPGLLAALARMFGDGREVMLAHGGGKALTGLLARLGLQSEFRRGLRVTDPATLAAAVMAFAGEVNKKLVGRLNAACEAAPGGRARAVGLTGLDGGVARARADSPELGLVGTIDAADARLLRLLLADGYAPVLAPLAGDGAGGALNVNADQFAAACAAAVGARRLVFVTDVAGVLDARGGVIPALSIEALEAMEADGGISGGMLPKTAACRHALQAGVAAVEIIGAAAARQLDVWEPGACPGTRVYKEGTA